MMEMVESDVASNQNGGPQTRDSASEIKIQIRVSGTLFQCHQGMFSTFPYSRLANIAAHKDNFNEENNEYRFERDPISFNAILDAYRSGVIHAPKEACPERFKEEINFWGLPVSHISPCCWKAFNEGSTNSYMANMITDTILSSVDVGFSPDGQLSMRQKIWLLIEKPNSSRAACLMAAGVTVIVMLSTLFLCLFSMYYLYDKPLSVFRWLERLCLLYLTIEKAACIITCQNLRYLLTNWMHGVEALAYVAFWLVEILEIVEIVNDSLHFQFVVRYLTIFRLVRVMRVLSNVEAFRIICLTMRSCFLDLVIFFSMFFFVSSFFGALLFVTSQFDADGYRFMDNILYGLYFAVVTATTVGYGDIIPHSAVGKVVAPLCALFGIICMMVMFSAISTKYRLVYHSYQTVKSQIERLQRLTPTGQIRLRVNDPIVLMSSNGLTCSFTTMPTIRSGHYNQVQQNTQS